MNDKQLIAVDGYEDAAGAIVWWDLTGLVDLMALEEAWLERGGDQKLVPAIPSAEVALQRAAYGAVKSKRELIRPLRRGAWDFQIESLTDDAESLSYRTAVKVRVMKGSEAQADWPTAVATEAQYEARAQEILSGYNYFRNNLIASDISAWLLQLLNVEVLGVSLRQRGGFYFVPVDRIPFWKRVSETLQSVSGHTMHEIPAMRAEDTVKAVLEAVRKEADAAFVEMEEYLAGDVSTRGINAAERKVAAVQTKLAKYAELLQAAMPDLEARATAILGAVTAARLITPEQGDA